MQRDNWTSEENKIANLLYINEPINDRLVLEILKNYKGSLKNLLPLITSLVINHIDLELRKEYLIFFGTQIRGDLYVHLKQKVNSGYHSISYSYLKTVLSDQEIAEIYYTHFKRTNRSLELFLKIDRWNHPGRKEVFDAFINSKIKGHTHTLDISLFSTEELNYYLNHPQINLANCNLLNLENQIIENLPEEIFNIPFSRIWIRNCKAVGFHDFIFRFPSIKNLRIVETKVTPIPEDWSKMQNLEDLTFNSTWHVFDNFRFTETLPNLKNLTILEDLIDNPNVLLTPKKVPLSTTPLFKNHGIYQLNNGRNVFQLPLQEVLSLGTAIAKSNLNKTKKEHYFHMLTNLKNLNDIPKLEIHELVAISTIPITKLKNVCTNRFNELAQSKKGINSINKESLVWILGTPSVTKTELAKQIKELVFKSTTKFTPEVTHVIIGKNPKEYEKLEGLDFELITENQIGKLVNLEKPKFIQQAAQSGDDSISEKVVAMLLSPEPANVNVGLELLKTGGVPANLMEDLLIVQKTCPDAKARKTAKKLLEQNAPAELLPLINDAQRFTAIFTEKAQATNKKLEALAKKTSREMAAKLSLIFHQKLGRGLRYILYHFHAESDIRSEAMSALVEDNCFNFTKGLGFKTWQNPEEAILYNLKIPVKITFEVADKHPNIEKAILHNCKMTKLPADVSKLKNLKHLDCSYNFLGSIPKAIGELENLEILDLKMNQFNTFPETVRYAKNLKTLDLRFNRPDGHTFKSLEISEKVKTALPNCDILV